MAQSKNVKLDLSKVKMAIRAGIPLSITTYTLPHEMELYMDSVLAAFLEELNQHHMIEYLTYCLNELVTNSKKANTKRIYFKEKRKQNRKMKAGRRTGLSSRMEFIVRRRRGKAF